VGTCEVTQQQWQAVMGGNPATFSKGKLRKPAPSNQFLGTSAWNSFDG
jgi:hypothetical protein